MGWWKINETGGIDWDEMPSGNDDTTGLVNAIPGRDTLEDHYNGDEPADVMERALSELDAIYQRVWGRKPYVEEIDAAFNFVMGPRRDGTDGEETDD